MSKEVRHLSDATPVEIWLLALEICTSMVPAKYEAAARAIQPPRPNNGIVRTPIASAKPGEDPKPPTGCPRRSSNTADHAATNIVKTIAFMVIAANENAMPEEIHRVEADI